MKNLFLKVFGHCGLMAVCSDQVSAQGFLKKLTRKLQIKSPLRCRLPLLYQRSLANLLTPQLP